MCPPRFAALFQRVRRELRIVGEVHAIAFADSARLRTGLGEMREWGWRVALADVADDDSWVRSLVSVKPDLVQIDFALPGRTAGLATPAVARLVAAAGEAGAELMAINVETAAAKAMARELGCALARGLAFGAPGSLPPA
jgi:EAL domain-containing protein (putative c-di-GMP-specific phosphodiesterase class I)